MPESRVADPASNSPCVRPRALDGVRVLVVMPSIPLQGMERANLEIMQLVRAHGADVLFITEMTYGHEVRAAVEAIDARWTAVRVTDTDEERLHVSLRPHELWSQLRAWARAAWGIRREVAMYEPTHVYITSFFAFLYALPAVVLGRAPIVFRLPNPPPPRTPALRRTVVRALWKLVLARADVVVCNCRYTAARTADLGVEGGKVRIIANVVPRHRRGDGEAARLDPRRFTVAYLGRIRHEKGVEQLVTAARRIIHERADVDFVLAGEHHWRNPFADALIRDLHRDGLTGRIRLLGDVEDVHSLLEQCRLHVCPSISEGESFPNVVLEAKAHAIPSVVFPTGGLPEAVTHLDDGYVCRDQSAPALYDGLRYFLDDAGALARAGAAAKASLARYSREEIGLQWVAVFDAGRRRDG